jgi:hypothetical protein
VAEGKDSSDGESMVTTNEDDTESLGEEDIDGASDEDESNHYTSQTCRKTLAKVKKTDIQFYSTVITKSN